ncbi:MAG: AAA family ATPase [Planctomycetes bacterium]|nr:AAA family ATPase [Planctomycetota bacterium]
MPDLLASAALFAVAGGLGFWIGRQRRGGSAVPATPGATPLPAPNSTDNTRAELYALAAQLENTYEGMAQPSDLRTLPQFQAAVKLLSSREFDTADVCRYAIGDNSVITCVALDALRVRADKDPFLPALLPGINGISTWGKWMFCDLLEARHPEPVLETLLLTIDSTWDTPMARRVFQDFVRRRLERGETVKVDERFAEQKESEPSIFAPPPKLTYLIEVIGGIDSDAARAFVAALRAGAAAGKEREALREVGRVLETDATGGIVLHRGLERALADAEACVARSRALLVVGRDGVGKSTLVRLVCERLRARGFTVFEAGSADLLADQSMMGQLEGRLQKLVAAVLEKPVVWVVPNFTELAWAGRHRHGRTSVLDTLMPHLESDRLRIVGEIEPDGFDQLLREQPRLRAAVDVVRLEPPSASETLDVARRWAEATPKLAPVGDATLREAADLAQQYLGETAAPGNLIGLLRLANEVHPAGDGRALEAQDLLQALTRLTGLPAAMLDERETLDLESLRQLFARRVLAQPEAVDCLVERVAMLKAGLVDPARPAGVFLFSGPTGTGKTEIARTLAEFLFGSPERLVRVDMSELTGPLAQSRLLGSGDERAEGALVHKIREAPFSVVLLDEVEKADASVWDLFLQVFDAGRLTDAQGRTADFRHAIFILTSNLGSELLVSRRLGFGRDAAGGSAGGASAVLDEIARHFRPEFMNRIDRVVVFRPLGRAVMRDILHTQLERVLALRGLRTRQWVVEWDESALDFLLDKGFSPAQGARPLRRAIERWFLSPLATAIVNRDAPSGDQFLFVRSNGHKIEVVFVDPDAPDAGDDEPHSLDVEVPEGLSLGRVALDGGSRPEEIAYLNGEFEKIAADVRGEAWTSARDAALAQMEEPDFWNAEARFPVLSAIEFRERVESGLAHAERLLGRLRAGKRGASAEVVRQLAHQLHLLEAAARTQIEGLPRDAFVTVEALRDRNDGAQTVGFARKLAAMYEGWAASRRMQIQELERVESAQTWRWTAAVSGYGAHELLRHEAGWHVLEHDAEHQSVRLRVRVTVLPQPDRPAKDPLADARAAGAAHAAKETHVVRRYRELPSPLVRDSVRGWRTGRLDRVLGGDFDLL